jgi:antitoxin component HigA of HigAB toxin-antitoxin module
MKKCFSIASQIEDRRRNASLDVMKRLATALGVSVDDLS